MNQNNINMKSSSVVVKYVCTYICAGWLRSKIPPSLSDMWVESHMSERGLTMELSLHTYIAIIIYTVLYIAFTALLLV